jgi:ABC-2 type transport system ATP-binding protein
MKQKLALCCALIHRPKILFLDEPTTGVDAVSRVEFWDMLKKLKAEGITILVSTAYMDEASRCDHIALINNGKILATDTPEGISRSFGETLWAIKHPDMYGLLNQLRSMKQIGAVYPSGEYHHLTLHTKNQMNELVNDLEIQGFRGANYMEIEANVEDVFMKQMK